MAIEINPPDEWNAAAKGALKALAKHVPGVTETLGAYEGYERHRKEKALAEFVSQVNEKFLRVQPTIDEEWLSSDDGQMFVGKLIDAALDAQTADKRQLFAIALASGAAADLPFATKMRFVDLLRNLSRMALDVLAELHQEFGAKVGKPESTAIMPERIAERLASGPARLDPYAVVSAIEELRSAGLFSHVTNWRRSADGTVSSSSSYAAGNIAYTEFSASFVGFITEPNA